MTRLIQCAALGLLLSAAALCGFGCWGIHQLVMSERQIALDSDATVNAATGTEQKIESVADNIDGLLSETRPELAETMRRLNGTIAHLDETSAGLSTAVKELNAPCVPGPCGTLADVNRTLGAIRLASGQVTAFSEREQTQLDQMNEQETAVAQLTEADLSKLGGAIDSITALADDKELKGSLTHLNTTTGALAGMATDTQQFWHDTLHPKWPKRVWNAITGVGISAAKFFF
jgi:hypothetical protein